MHRFGLLIWIGWLAWKLIFVSRGVTRITTFLSRHIFIQSLQLFEDHHVHFTLLFNEIRHRLWNDFLFWLIKLLTVIVWLIITVLVLIWEMVIVVERTVSIPLALWLI